MMEIMSTSCGATAARRHAALVFGLGLEEYAIDMAVVQELRGVDAMHLAYGPGSANRVASLRGTLVPLVDLRRRFGHPVRGDDAGAMLLIVALGGKTIGLVVDRVTGVASLAPELLPRQAPAGGVSRAGLLPAMIAGDGRRLHLIDTGWLLSDFGRPAGAPPALRPATAPLCAGDMP
jgi:purine-binding chemotaxis protein CheW